MGLLEKAQHKKKAANLFDEEESRILDEKTAKAYLKKASLLEKAKQRRNKPAAKTTPIKEDIEIKKTEEKITYAALKAKEKGNRDVIEEKTGFGWKGLGIRRIVFDHTINEFIYELSEPVLNEYEKDTMKELSHLFKMLADVNITNMDKHEKEKFLKDTLEQIIIDNNITFGVKRKKKSEEIEKKGLGFLKKKNKEEKKENEEQIKNDNKEKAKEETETEINQNNEAKDGEVENNKKDEEEEIKDENETAKEYKHEVKEVEVIEENKEDQIKDEEETKQDEKKKSFMSKLSFKKDKKGGDKPKIIKLELTEAQKKSKEKIYYHIFKDFLGYGKIDIVMEDEGIEDISCDGHHVPIFIYHKKYDEITSNIKFDDEEDLNSFVVRLAQICGKQISIYSPIVDGKLPDGSRLQTTLARTVTKGSTFTIRKFKENPLTPIDLIDFKSVSLDMAAYFWMAIERGASILFCGGTASGKTTVLNALSLFIPAQHKVITIEDTREINLPHQNWIAGTTRQGFSSSEESKTGKDIDMFDLIRAALRQRPKVVMVGEVRGKEAYSLFQAMATGHTSYATVHASDINTLIQRLENPPISLPRALLTSLDIIVFQNAIDIAGKTVRRMTSVTEIVKLDPDTNQLIFMEPYKWVSKTDDRFESSGASKILNNIKLQNDWTDERLLEELENRKAILNWMLNKDIRDYKNVGGIVADYSKYPEQLIKKAKEEMKK